MPERKEIGFGLAMIVGYILILISWIIPIGSVLVIIYSVVMILTGQWQSPRYEDKFILTGIVLFGLWLYWRLKRD
ncbi:MAG: hypothetical protein PHH44_05630 [bacterium]|nr:hypothetical protein [bacterium]